MPTCNLRITLKRAVDAFLRELDKMTLADAIISPNVAASLLQIRRSENKEVTVPISALARRARASSGSKGYGTKAGRRPKRSGTRKLG